ncbi:MAG: flippase-like domain-containing protein [Deltaproteobacteria bacterium]|nr:flippase-like domain-containing protein [Deltaproteobacteria bacterium]
MVKLVKLVFALIVFYLLFRFAGVSDLIAVFVRISWSYVSLLIILPFIMIWASSIKWQVFIRATGHDARILQLMKFYTVGYFFNTFLPSFIGGDVVRSYHLGQELNNYRLAFAATFLERFTGLLAMCLISLSFVLAGSEITKGVEIVVYLMATVTVLVALPCFSEHCAKISFFVTRRGLSLFGPAKYFGQLTQLTDKIEEAMSFARHNGNLLIKAMIWSLVFHSLTVVNTYVAGLALGISGVSITGLFVVVPLVLLVGMAPVTPGGLGIQEGAFMFFLNRLGISEAEALGVGLVIRAKTMLIGLVGGIFWLAVKSKRTNK